MKTLSVFMLTSFSFAAKLPENIKKCSKSDAKLEDCLINAVLDAFKVFASGYKPLGIEVLEPISIAELSNDGRDGITQKYKNIKLSGTSTCIPKEFKLDLNELTIKASVECSRIEIIADYILKREILSLPIDSSGKCNITLHDVQGAYDVKLERVEKGGQKYLLTKDWKMKIIPKQVHFYFENIMPGNKQISEMILNTMNENGVQIFLDQVAGFEKDVALLHTILANKVLEEIPEDELFLP